jgi:hypothetical protein
MPYKDPERKRQWERAHRDQRNARRRKLSSSHSPGSSSTNAPQSDPNLSQVTLSSVSVARGVMMGVAFLLTMFFLIRRFGSSSDPLQVPELESVDRSEQG